MADQTGAQQLFDLWKKQVEEGTRAWLKMAGQGQSPDPQAFWRPFMDQGMQAWSKVMTQGQPSPDLMAQWKQFLDQWIAAWSKVLEQAMGKQLEGFLNQAGPAKKAAEQHIEATLAGLGVPSRSQVVGIAKHIISLEEKIDAVDDRIDTMLKRLEELTAAVRKDRA